MRFFIHVFFGSEFVGGDGGDCGSGGCLSSGGGARHPGVLVKAVGRVALGEGFHHSLKVLGAIAERPLLRGKVHLVEPKAHSITTSLRPSLRVGFRGKKVNK